MGLLKWALLGAFLGGCAADEGPSPSRIDGPRVLAIQASPPEATPGDAVALQVTVAGLSEPPPIEWAWCATPKPPTENTVVDPACLGSGVAAIAATGPAINALIPADACRLFGPISPGPGLRPRDADVTGGYYQPVRVTVGAVVAVGLVRLRCGLNQAPLRATQRYAAEYVDNANPVILALDAPDSVGPGEVVALRLEADAPEPYVRFDPAARALVDDAEVLTVAWFSTAGALTADGAALVDGRANVGWRAPTTPGPVTLFAVLRDSRGGAAVQRLTIEVR